MLQICDIHDIITPKQGVNIMGIGEKIKKRREELQLSADQLATLINKNRATVYRLSLIHI